MSRLPASTVAAVAAGALVFVGCGVDTEKAGRSAKTSTTAAPVRTSKGPEPNSPAARQARLPTRPDGTVAIAGQQNAFTDKLVSDFGASSQSVRVTNTRINEGNAYDLLCSGRSDIVQTSIAPTPADYRACASNGLEIANPVQLGSDAVVLATRNQSDVGGDCLNVRQARDIFRDGSPYTNWNQLGFDDLTLRTAGRDDGSDNFEFFGLQALGLANPTLGNVRADFAVRTTDSAERRLVTGVDAMAAANARADRYASRQRRRTKAARKQAIDRAVARADRQVNREIARVNARNKRLKKNVDGAKLSRDNARKAAAAKAVAREQAARTFDTAFNRRIQRYRSRGIATAERNGYIGHFSFSYYELFEAVLRPMEIDFGTPETNSGQPVRFGDLAKADQQRLAPAVRAGLAQRAGRPTSDLAPSGASGTTGSVADIGEETTLPNIDGLPAKTATGQPILTGPNCVFPSQLTVTTGAYPLTRRIFYVTTKTGLQRPEVRKLLTYALDKVQGQAGGARVVPITDQQRREGYITVTGRPPGDQPADVNAKTPVPGTGSTGATGSGGGTGGTGRSGTTGTTGSGSTGSAGSSGTATSPTPEPGPADRPARSAIPGVAGG